MHTPPPHAGSILIRKAATVLLGFACAAGASANDGYGALGMGGLLSLGKTDEIRMKKEVLEVSTDKIRVDYVFERSPIAKQDRIPVIFPLPLYGPEEASWSWAGAPGGFSVRVDGKSLGFKSVVKGRLSSCPAGLNTRTCSRDVTAQLKAAGLSDAQIVMFPGASPFSINEQTKMRIPNLTEAQKKRLMKQALLAEEGFVSPYPLWLADVTYVWGMAFNGRQELAVSHEYIPFTSGGAESYYFTEQTLRDEYCADDALIAAWKNVSKGDGAGNRVLPSRRVEYILTTANSWQGSIADFTLRLKKAKPTELVSLCFPGKVRKIDAMTLEIALKDFNPKQELKVVFLNVDDVAANGASGIPPALSR